MNEQDHLKLRTCDISSFLNILRNSGETELYEFYAKSSF